MSPSLKLLFLSREAGRLPPGHQISADEGSLLPSARAASLLVLWVLLHVQDNQGSTGLHRGDVSRSLGFVLSVASLQLPTVR